MDAPENRRLSSWKQIARYLGRDRRTVMRWEKRWGMPVRRPGGEARGSSVYAYTAELDAWLERGGPHENDAENGAGEADEGASGAFSRRALGLAAAAVVALAAAMAWMRSPGPVAPPSEVVTAGDVMTVLAADGSVAWTWRHPEGRSFHNPGHLGRFIDLDGDDAPELLLSINTVDPEDEALTRSELLTFGSDRQLAWRAIPTDSLTFGEEMFGPPWIAESFDVATLDGETRLIWRVHHATWWPSVLEILSTDGTRVGRFVNSGWLLDGAALSRPGGDLVLAGGISNSRGGAMLAVLDPGAPDATSPEESGGPYECLTCPPGRPLRYVVFGPSHVNVASSLPYNRTVSIQPADGGFEAIVLEGVPGSEVQWVYEFDAELELLRATPGDSYWPQHERLRQEGRIDHTGEACPERSASPPVSVWTPDDGWQTVTVPLSGLTPS